MYIKINEQYINMDKVDFISEIKENEKSLFFTIYFASGTNTTVFIPKADIDKDGYIYRLENVMKGVGILA